MVRTPPDWGYKTIGQPCHMDEGGSVWFWKSKTGVRAATNVKNADYPRMSADKGATFRVYASEARKVQVAPLVSLAQNNGLQRPGPAAFDLTKDAQGYWTVTTPLAVPGFPYYHLLIDGAAVLDPSRQVSPEPIKERRNTVSCISSKKVRGVWDTEYYG